MNLDFHVITPAGPVHICSLVAGKAIIPPGPPVPPPAPAGAPAQPTPGK